MIYGTCLDSSDNKRIQKAEIFVCSLYLEWEDTKHFTEASNI